MSIYKHTNKWIKGNDSNTISIHCIVSRHILEYPLSRRSNKRTSLYSLRNNRRCVSRLVWAIEWRNEYQDKPIHPRPIVNTIKQSRHASFGHSNCPPIRIPHLLGVKMSTHRPDPEPHNSSYGSQPGKHFISLPEARVQLATRHQDIEIQYIVPVPRKLEWSPFFPFLLHC